MVDIFCSILISSLLGTLSGLGIGGGSLLMIWLTSVLQYDIRLARCINLLFFFPAAAISVFSAIHRKDISFRQCVPSAVCGCISALLFSLAAKSADSSILQKALGFLLIIIALHELFWKKRPG